VSAPRFDASRLVWDGFGEGGVIADVPSGHFFRANAAALRICEALARDGAREGLSERIAGEFGLERLVAKRWIEDVVASLASLQAPAAEQAPMGLASPVGVFRVRLSDGQLRLFHDELPVLAADGLGASLWRLDEGPLPLAFYLRLFAPRLLALRGRLVLHASACRSGDDLTVFAGRSGAGKTTTVRALVRVGATAVSEDLVVLHLEGGRALAVLAGEAGIRAWAERAASELAGRPRATVGCEGLEAAAFGLEASLPLRSIEFIDAAAGRTTDFLAAPLARVEIMERLVWATFLGSSARGAWSSLLASCRAVAEQVEARDVRLPEGLAALDLWASAYIANSAS
jgi:hypothetical protein